MVYGYSYWLLVMIEFFNRLLCEYQTVNLPLSSETTEPRLLILLWNPDRLKSIQLQVFRRRMKCKTIREDDLQWSFKSHESKFDCLDLTRLQGRMCTCERSFPYHIFVSDSVKGRPQIFFLELSVRSVRINVIDTFWRTKTRELCHIA